MTSSQAKRPHLQCRVNLGTTLLDTHTAVIAMACISSAAFLIGFLSADSHLSAFSMARLSCSRFSSASTTDASLIHGAGRIVIPDQERHVSTFEAIIPTPCTSRSCAQACTGIESYTNDGCRCTVNVLQKITKKSLNTRSLAGSG